MRKTILGTTIILLALLLAACGSSPASTASGSSNFSRNSSSAANRPPSETMILAVGTIKLDGTPQAVNAAEAAKLIPLWQLMNQLNASSSTAPQEITAVVNAIQSTMTPDQTQAIQNMQISQRDIFTVLQQTGGFQGGGGNGQGGFTRSGNGGNFGGANRNAGGGGGGLGFLFGGGPTAGTATRTPSSSSSGTGTAGGGLNSFTTVLIDQLIKLLQTKAQTG